MELRFRPAQLHFFNFLIIIVQAPLFVSKISKKGYIPLSFYLYLPSILKKGQIHGFYIKKRSCLKRQLSLSIARDGRC